MGTALVRTYSVVLVAASAFTATVFTATGTARAEVNAVRAVERAVFQGFVLATDSCQLAPLDWSGLCSTSVVPIAGELRLRKRGSLQRIGVKLDSNGVFTEKLEPGAYRVRLIEPRVASHNLKRSAYRIFPRQVRIQRGLGGSARAASQANVFLVAHKSRGTPVGVGVSDGFRK
jgi:hypothetical protein